MKHNNQHLHCHPILGILFIVIGIILLFNKMDIIDTPYIWKFWPIILIAIGYDRLIEARVTKKYYKAIWMLLLGTWLFIAEMQLFGLNYHNSWPVLIICFGIVFLLKSVYHSSIANTNNHQVTELITPSGENTNGK